MIEERFLDDVRRDRLIAIVRGTDGPATAAAALTLIEEGVRLIEISLSGTDAPAALAQVVERAGDAAWVGAGTVLTAPDADVAASSGAKFTVTPALAPSVSASRAHGLPVLAGALTPTEIVAASASATAVKLFPASCLGVEYLRAIRAPLPDTPIVPVGGIDAPAAAEYLAAGAIAVGVGSPLLGDAPHRGGDLAALRRRARDFLARVSR